MTKSKVSVRRIHASEDFCEVSSSGYQPSGEILKVGTLALNDYLNHPSLIVTSPLKIVRGLYSQPIEYS